MPAMLSYIFLSFLRPLEEIVFGQSANLPDIDVQSTGHVREYFADPQVFWSPLLSDRFRQSHHHMKLHRHHGLTAHCASDHLALHLKNSPPDADHLIRNACFLTI